MQKALYFVFLMLMCGVKTAVAQDETFIQGDLYFIKIANGLNTVYQPSKTNETHLQWVVRTGGVYENDSTAGICRLLQMIMEERLNAALSKSSLLTTSGFFSYTTSEQTVFQFKMPSYLVQKVLKLITDSVYLVPVRQIELNAALNRLRQQRDSGMSDNAQQLERRLTKTVFRADYYRLLPETNPFDYRFITVQYINDWHERFYVGPNSLLAVSSNLHVSEFTEVFKRETNAIKRSDFDPETVGKIFDFKPMIYTTQFTQVADNNEPEFHICFQLHGVNINREESYCAFLLSAMLNDPYNYINVKAKMMGAKNLQAQLQANNFSAMFRVVLQPGTENPFAVYEFVRTELLRLEQTLANESMLNFAKLQFQKEYELLKKSPDFPQWVVKFWPFNDESYFLDVRDSVMAITEKQFQRFVTEYFHESPYVTALYISEDDRAELKADSLFPDLNDAVHEYTFSYRTNVTELEGAENLQKLSRLIQWLKINPELSVQINGFSDQGEFNKTYDDSIFAFIDSIPTFAKTNPDKVKKRYLRPEMMRAMRIIKTLADNGIDISRISGTSMMSTSDTREEAIANAKCTITIIKYRKPLPLYEYHYGKPKPK